MGSAPAYSYVDARSQAHGGVKSGAASTSLPGHLLAPLQPSLTCLLPCLAGWLWSSAGGRSSNIQWHHKLAAATPSQLQPRNVPLVAELETARLPLLRPSRHHPGFCPATPCNLVSNFLRVRAHTIVARPGARLRGACPYGIAVLLPLSHPRLGHGVHSRASLSLSHSRTHATRSSLSLRQFLPLSSLLCTSSVALFRARACATLPPPHALSNTRPPDPYMLPNHRRQPHFVPAFPTIALTIRLFFLPSLSLSLYSLPVYKCLSHLALVWPDSHGACSRC